MDLSPAIGALASGTYSVTRTAVGSWGSGLPVGMGGPIDSVEDGRYRPGATSSFQILASVQPLSGRDLMRLPEGQRSRALIKIYTATALRVADAPDGTPADQITFQGSVYEVQTVEPWDETGRYLKAIAAKVQS